MAQSIHISTLRKMLKAGDPVDLKLWTKSGEIQCWRNCIPLRYNFYQGTQQFKLLDSHQIRQAASAAFSALIIWKYFCRQ